MIDSSSCVSSSSMGRIELVGYFDLGGLEAWNDVELGSLGAGMVAGTAQGSGISLVCCKCCGWEGIVGGV